MDDNKNILIAIAFSLVAVLGLYLLSGSNDSKISETRSSFGKDSQKHKIIKKIKRQPKRYSAPVARSYSGSRVSANVSPFTEEEEERLKKNRIESRKRLVENSQKWLEEMVNNESLDEKTREKYRLKLNKNFVEGKIASKNKDYKTALKKFYKALKDPSATVTSKYYIYMNLKILARKMNDIELFIIISKEEGRMLADNEIPVLDLKKSGDALEWITEFETYTKAKKNASIFNKLVTEEIKRTNGAIGRDQAEAKIFEKIKEYEYAFKGRKA